MITRKIGGLLRGKATPFQLMAACILGALLGFAPSPLQAPALYVLLVAVLLVVNANLGLALLTAGLARLLSFVAVPVSFEVGRFLLDGPTSGLAQSIVNAPILAWCGLEYYAVAGGQLIGLVVGILAAVMVPMMQGRIDSAKWSEGRAVMGTIARALRAHIAEKGANFTPVPTLEQLGIAPGDLDGTYFAGGESGAGDFSWVITSSNPMNFLITAKAPSGVKTPSQITLDRAGTFTETP